MKTHEEKLITAVKKIISNAMGTDYQLSYYEIDKILRTLPDANNSNDSLMKEEGE